MRNSKLRNQILCAIFTALIAIGAFIRIPVPVVPAGVLLGSRLGATSVILYIVLGLLGVPVFAEGGGPGYILKPSFGYLPGFAIGAYISGYFAEKTGGSSFKNLLLGNALNLAVVYLCGMVYCYVISNYYLGTPIAIWPLVLYCFILAVPGDAVLCVVAAILGSRLVPVIGVKACHTTGSHV